MIKKKNYNNKPVIIFFGPAGSGKGTQADLLAQKTQWHKITMGELLRHEVSHKTSLGKEANKYLPKGILAPDVLTDKLLIKHLQKSRSAKGLIFDGYPRNFSQLNSLLTSLKKIIYKNINSSSVSKFFSIFLEVSDQEVKQRLGGRRSCSCGAVYHLKYNPSKVKEICDLCGGKLVVRDDDKPRAIAARLRVFHRQVKPVLDYFRKNNKLITINGEQSIAKIHLDIVAKLNHLKII